MYNLEGCSLLNNTLPLLCTNSKKNKAPIIRIYGCIKIYKTKISFASFRNINSANSREFIVPQQIISLRWRRTQKRPTLEYLQSQINTFKRARMMVRARGPTAPITGRSYKLRTLFIVSSQCFSLGNNAPLAVNAFTMCRRVIRFNEYVDSTEGKLRIIIIMQGSYVEIPRRVESNALHKLSHCALSSPGSARRHLFVPSQTN